MSAAISLHATTAPVFHLAGADMSFLQDVHPEVFDAILGFVYDPLDRSVNARLDDFLDPVSVEDSKRCRACGDDDQPWLGFNAGARGLVDQQGSVCAAQTQVPALAPALAPEHPTVLALPAPPPPMQPRQQLPPPAFVRGTDAKMTAGNRCQPVQSAVARQRRKRISDKTAELSRLIPGGHKLSTADMLQAAADHVKLLQAQVGMLALMHTVEAKVPSMAQKQMHALLSCGGVQERLAGEGKCLVPRKLLHTVAKDKTIKNNLLVSRDLNWFMQSLEQ